MRVEVEFRDIVREPPDRAFLEKHVAADRLGDFLSKRSPVFKTQPLPSSKEEAIELMLQQPNLIRRPILVKGSRVVFGFDKEQYRKLLA
jgi:arsenate reductase